MSHIARIPRLALGTVVLAGLMLVAVFGLSMAADAAAVTDVSGDVSYGASTTVDAGDVLRFDPTKDTTLEVSGNLIIEGTLEMKPNDGVTHTLKFLGVDEDDFVGGGMEVLESDRGLWVIGAGKLDLHGEEKVGWNRTGSDPTWSSSDELRVAPYKVGDYGVDGFDTFTLGSPVPKADASLPATEVVNLTRSVNIEGTAAGRAHVTIMSSVSQEVRYVAFRHLGPRQPDGDGDTEGVMGRYPLHFHQVGEGSRGSVVEGNVVRDSGNRGVVVHLSNGVTATDNVIYDVYDDPFWWDLGEENASDDVVLEDNFVGLVRTDPVNQGFALTGFHLGRGEGNVANGNVVVGVLGNKNCSGFQWPSQGSGLWEFRDNVAHNNKCHGIFVWQNSSANHLIEDFVAYRNGTAGISHGAYTNDYVYEDIYLFENEEMGVLSHAFSHPPRTGQMQQTWSCVEVVGSPVGLTIAVSNAAEFGDPAIFNHFVTDDTPVLYEVQDAALDKGQTIATRATFNNLEVPCPEGGFSGTVVGEGTFVDDDASPHQANIEILAEAGITVGCNPPDNNMFCPGDPVTRAQMATFLTRALDLPEASIDYFRDDESSTHESGINSLAAAEISSGCNQANTNYCPGDHVTRAQMASFLVRALNLPASTINSFVDDDNSSHESNINALAAAEITTGCKPADRLYCPSDSVTRAQMATFLVKALDLH